MGNTTASASWPLCTIFYFNFSESQLFWLNSNMLYSVQEDSAIQAAQWAVNKTIASASLALFSC